MSLRVLTCLPRVGGKGRLLHRLLPRLGPLLARGEGYVEPFVGGAAVAMALLKHRIVRPERMLLGDTDPAVVQFWLAVRDRTEEMAKAAVTAHCDEGEWEDSVGRIRRRTAWQVFAADPVEAAFDQLMMARWSWGGKSGNIQFCWRKRPVSAGLAARVRECGRLLNGVRIVCRPFEETLAIEPEAVGYLDPPYWSQTRAHGFYRDRFGAVEHGRLRSLLLERKAPWVLSYDPDPCVYRDYQGVPGVGWEEFDVGGGMGNGPTGRHRREVMVVRR